jgi:hypothetical protein
VELLIAVYSMTWALPSLLHVTVTFPPCLYAFLPFLLPSFLQYAHSLLTYFLASFSSFPSFLHFF